MTPLPLLFILGSACGGKSPPDAAASPNTPPSIALTYAHLPGQIAEVSTTVSKATYQGDPETTPPQRAMDTTYKSSMSWGEDDNGPFVTTQVLETSTPVVVALGARETFMSDLTQTLSEGMVGLQYTLNIDANGTPSSLRESSAFDQWFETTTSHLQATLEETIATIPENEPALTAVAQSTLGGVTWLFSKEKIVNDLIADSLLFSGQWIGADLEIGAEYQLDIVFDSNSAGAIPGTMYFSAYQMVPCYEGAAKDSCVHLVSVTEGDPKSTLDQVSASMRTQFAPMLEAAPPDKRKLMEASMALKSATTERVVNVIAEPTTLRPWYTQKIETNTLTMAMNEVPVTYKISSTETVYVWSDKPSQNKMEESTKP